MSGSGNLVNLIKEIAVGAVSASEPVQIVYGVVVSESPLKIKNCICAADADRNARILHKCSLLINLV